MTLYQAPERGSAFAATLPWGVDSITPLEE
jgi:hypothetical protein